MRKKFWYIVHNVIAHPLLVLGFKWTDRFHDWTFDKFSDVILVAYPKHEKTQDNNIKSFPITVDSAYLGDMLENVYHHRIDAETAYYYISERN